MTDEIALFLEQYNQTVYLVGGCLRQRLLSKPVDDFDLIVSSGAIRLAKKLAETFKLKWIILDRQRDIARVFHPVSTFDFAAFGEDLLWDLKARDLTINALACPVNVQVMNVDVAVDPNTLIDPCGGLEDLKHGKIRGIQRANFESDPLRLLRIFRFSACLEFEVDLQTLLWVEQLKDNIKAIASERILLELWKLLTAKNSAKTVALMYQSGLAQVIFSQAQQPRDLIQQLQELENKVSDPNLQFELQTYLSSRLVDKRSVLFLLKLALILWQDSPKKEPERMRFFNDRMLDLSLSRLEVELLNLWHRLADVLEQIIKQPEDPVLKMVFFRLGQQHCLGVLMLAEPGFLRINVNNDILVSLLKHWLDPNDQLAHPIDLINGRDVLKVMKMAPGPRVGRILADVQAAQARGEVQNKEAALDYLRQLLPDNRQ